MPVGIPANRSACARRALRFEEKLQKQELAALVPKAFQI
jgi:hypothetical protein